MKKKHQRSNARLDAFTRGVIWGMHVAGMKRDQMLDHVRKKDGTKLNLHNLDPVISRKKQTQTGRARTVLLEAAHTN